MRPKNTDNRYPYTYACDWLRMCEVAKSRSEASALYDGYDEACSLADQYIIYWSLIADAEDVLLYSKQKLGSI